MDSHPPPSHTTAVPPPKPPSLWAAPSPALLFRSEHQQVSWVFLFLVPSSQHISKSCPAYLQPTPPPRPPDPTLFSPSPVMLSQGRRPSPLTWMKATTPPPSPCSSLLPLQSVFHRLTSLILIKCKSNHGIPPWLPIALRIKIWNPEHFLWGCAWPDSDLSPASSHGSLSPLPSHHSGLFSPYLLQALECLKAFTIAVSSAWNIHLPDSIWMFPSYPSGLSS